MNAKQGTLKVFRNIPIYNKRKTKSLIMNDRIIFVSNNKNKIDETKTILNSHKIRVISSSLKIHELQTNDIHHLVKDKTVKAFKSIKSKLIVEHTGLFVNFLNNLPGVQTQDFWDRLNGDGFTKIAQKFTDKTLIAQTIISYCDCKKIYLFHGEITGTISCSPRGNREFQWDCIFIPDGYQKTFAELGPDVKNLISMRKIALDKFAEHFKNEN